MPTIMCRHTHIHTKNNVVAVIKAHSIECKMAMAQKFIKNHKRIHSSMVSYKLKKENNNSLCVMIQRALFRLKKYNRFFFCCSPLYFDKLQKLDSSLFVNIHIKKTCVFATQRDHNKWKQCKILSKNMKMVIWPSHSYMYCIACSRTHIPFTLSFSPSRSLFCSICLRLYDANVPPPLEKFGKSWKQCKKGIF